ncbi:hypothetical protein G6F37_013015 [Rhizopus arrhizus]|nr:hypothetical protein G6F37_013015 [Rhizopus arrhizus]
MEIDHNAPLADISNSTWLQNSVCETADTLENTGKKIVSRGPIACQCCNPKIFRWGNNRDLTVPKQKLPIKIFHPAGKNQAPTHFRLQAAEPVPSSRTLQNGRGTGSKGNYRKRRLLVQNRFERRVRGSPNSSRISRFFKFPKSRHCVPIYVASVWAKRGPPRILQDYEACNRTLKKRGNSSRLLFGRYLYHGKNKTRNEFNNKTYQNTSRKIGVHYQLCEKQFRSGQISRIPWVSIQHEDNGDIGAKFENQQFIEENQATAKNTNSDMPMDSRNAREDDVDDSGNRRGSITHSISSTRSGEESTADTSRLGSNLQVVLYQPRRTPLVGEFCLSEEWTSNPKDCTCNPEGNNSCGCFQYGLGDKLPISNNIRVLDTRGSSTINKRQRAEDDSLCYTTPCKKMRKLRDQDIFRQHDSAKPFESKNCATSSTSSRFINIFQESTTRKRIC